MGKSNNSKPWGPKTSKKLVMNNDTINHAYTESSNQLNTTKNKSRSPNLKVQDFTKSRKDTSNNDSSEISNQMSVPQSLKGPPETRHSQTPTNPKKRSRTDVSSEEEDSIGDLVKQIKNLKRDMEQLKEIVNLQDKEIKSLKSKVLDNQISKSSKSVIVKGLEPETIHEMPSQLKTTFNKVLTDMGIQSKTTVCEIYRIKSKTPPPKAPQMAVHEPVKVAFQNSFQRSTFMKNLKNLKTYKNLKISMDCPKLLIPDYRLADQKAYDLRTQTPGTKTILTIKNQKITLLVQGANQKTFKEWKEPIAEAEM